MATQIKAMMKKNTMHPFFNLSAKPVHTAVPSGIEQSAIENSSSVPQTADEALENTMNAAHISDKSRRNFRPNIKARKAGATTTSAVKSLPDVEMSLEVDPNAGRRKRRKTESIANEEEADESSKPSKGGKRKITKKDKSRKAELEVASASASAKDELVVEGTTVSLSNGNGTSHEEGVSKAVKSDSTVADAVQHGTSSAQTTRPLPAAPVVKILRFNPKTGTIGSPPRKITKLENLPAEDASGVKSEAESDVIRTAQQRNSKIVVLKYDEDPASEIAMGSRIDRILQSSRSSQALLLEEPEAGQTRSLNTPTVSDLLPKTSSNVVKTSGKAPNPKSDLPAKTTTLHPFFLGKAAAGVAKKSQSSANNDSCDNRPPEPVQNEGPIHVSPKKSPMIKFAGFGKSSVETTSKVPGAVSPAWPWKGFVHIRGKSEADSLPGIKYSSPKSEKKLKSSEIQVLAHENALMQISTRLATTSSEEIINPDHYEKPPKVLRIPVHHTKSGCEIQRQIRPEITSKLPPLQNIIEEDVSSEDELQSRQRSKVSMHHAIDSVYISIANSLSAFDKSECETQSWCQKYAPSSAEEVLQSGHEAVILRDWLKTLTVKLVDSGFRSGKSTSSEKEPSKKKKKTGKDSFIVSTDDEADSMEEILDLDEPHFLGARNPMQKTVVRSGDLNGKKGSHKLKNAVVISGPSGCGKTAAVFAVAKELNFEIFEINPGSRRSGKDILEKVGDMTRNHLVQRPTGDAQAPLDAEMQSVADALDRDLKSGRQGTMNSFFKTKTAVPKPKSKSVKPKSSSAKPVKPPPKEQKQSLILIEEADIIYEEDKQFWSTVLTLVSRSKRPVIITCNDESVVPIQALALHAILRFSPAPLNLATDYMLLVAANEGHILKRKAIKALYESRGSDLRGSLTELQFWCQFAVGDPQKGLKWRHDCWPVDRRKDETGHFLRTVSEGTYCTGMGWLSRDLLEEDQPSLDVEEETLRQAWAGWHLDAGNWHETLNLSRWAGKLESCVESKVDKSAALALYEHLIETMSAADICTGHEFSSGHQILLDTTAPDLSEKALTDFPLGYEPINASDLVTHDSFGTDISFWLKTRAREMARSDQSRIGWGPASELTHAPETSAIEQIRRLGTRQDPSLTRQDLANAFDVLAESEDHSSLSSASLEPSVFDRTTRIVVLDVAPFVRSIVSHDQRLQRERLRQSNLLSRGGTGKRKLRSTRAANAALSGGTRLTTRPEKYFGPSLNAELVLRTGQRSWQEASVWSDERASSGAGGSGASVN